MWNREFFHNKKNIIKNLHKKYQCFCFVTDALVPKENGIINEPEPSFGVRSSIVKFLMIPIHC